MHLHRVFHVEIEISYHMRDTPVSFATKRLIPLIFSMLNAYMKHYISFLTCSSDTLILLLKIHVLD